MSGGEGTSAGLWEVENGVGGTYYAHRLGVTRQQTARPIRKKSLNGFSLPLLRKQHVVTA
jgi:hypothetical protein